MTVTFGAQFLLWVLHSFSHDLMGEGGIQPLCSAFLNGKISSLHFPHVGADRCEKIRGQVFNFLSLRNGPELLTWGDWGGFLVLQRSQTYLRGSK